MKKEDCFYFGKVMKTHGINGGISIRIESDHPNVYRKVKYLLVDYRNGLIPFFVENIVIKGDKAYVDLTDVTTIEKAQELAGKEIYLPMDLLPKLADNQFYLHEVKGYKLVDEIKGELGEVSDILEYPNQAIIQVFINKKEVLIPAQKEIIVKVDRKEKTLIVHAPDGLIDMYLES